MINQTDRVLFEVEAERHRQDLKWGEQNHEQLYWLGIIVEEVGGAAKAMIEGREAQAREELVQAAASCVAAIESMDRAIQRKFAGVTDER